MTKAEKEAIASMVVVCDTREQETPALKRRLTALKADFRREALKEGDYTCEYQKTASKGLLRLPVVVERKMNLAELALCFTSERGRFEREMERIKEKGLRAYLLIENASWEDIYDGNYRSQMSPESLVGSLLAWSIRYGLHIIFCRSATTGKLIGDIFRHEVAEDMKRKDGEEP